MMLEAGMAIWSTGWNLERFEITRVTATQAIIERANGVGNKYEIRFDREIKDGCGFFERGSHGYGRTVYYVETQKILAEYKRKDLVRKCGDIKFEKLSDETLENILALIP